MFVPKTNEIPQINFLRVYIYIKKKEFFVPANTFLKIERNQRDEFRTRSFQALVPTIPQRYVAL